MENKRHKYLFNFFDQNQEIYGPVYFYWHIIIVSDYLLNSLCMATEHHDKGPITTMVKTLIISGLILQ